MNLIQTFIIISLGLGFFENCAAMFRPVIVPGDEARFSHLPARLRMHAGEFSTGFQNRLRDFIADNPYPPLFAPSEIPPMLPTIPELARLNRQTSESSGRISPPGRRGPDPIKTNPLVLYIRALIRGCGLDGEINIQRSNRHLDAMKALGLNFDDPERTKDVLKGAPQWVAPFAGCFNTFILEEARQKSNPIAQYILGLEYYFGIGLRPNENEAFGWMHAAAMHGTFKPAIDHCIMYFQDQSTTQELENFNFRSKVLGQGGIRFADFLAENRDHKWTRRELLVLEDLYELLPTSTHVTPKIQEFYEGLSTNISQAMHWYGRTPVTHTSLTSLPIALGSAALLSYGAWHYTEGPARAMILLGLIVPSFLYNRSNLLFLCQPERLRWVCRLFCNVFYQPPPAWSPRNLELESRIIALYLTHQHSDLILQESYDTSSRIGTLIQVISHIIYHSNSASDPAASILNRVLDHFPERVSLTPATTDYTSLAVSPSA